MSKLTATEIQEINRRMAAGQYQHTEDPPASEDEPAPAPRRSRKKAEAQAEPTEGQADE